MYFYIKKAHILYLEHGKGGKKRQEDSTDGYQS